jgi:RNase H-fold protein (predicted Holliday junction resolvase)
MAGEHLDPAAQETKRIEREGQFDRLVLGHPLYEVDTDQIIGKKVAEMLELLPKGVPVECVAHVSDAHLDNTSTLVIEGFDPNRPGTNTPETGNFHNGPHDEPAAFMILKSILKNPPREDDPSFASRFNELLGAELGKIPGLHGKEKRPLRQKLLNLVFWLSERESTGQTTGKFKGIDYPRVLENDDLKVFSEIFNDLKYNIDSDGQGDKEARLFAAADELFDNLFDTSESRRPLSEIYNEQIEESRRRRAEVTRLLQEHLLIHDMSGEETGVNTQHLKTTRLSNGLQVTYVDISGTGIRHGGPRFAIEAVKRHTQSLEQPDGADTDVLVFANDEFGPDGKPNGRKKLMIKIPKEHHGAGKVNVEELAARLNESEKLFGGGETLISVATYGGHNEVVVSPQFEGTELDTEKIFVGVQNYADNPRYSASEFAERAKRFADKLGTTNYSIKLDEPQNEYDIAQRSIIIPRSNGGVVLVHEDELDLYESAFTETASENFQIVEQKTEKSEAPDCSGCAIDWSGQCASHDR